MTEQPTLNYTLIRAMQRFAADVKTEDLAGLSRENGRGENAGPKGAPTFSPPPDYRAVEMLADLQEALKREDYHSALTPYFTLRRLMNR